MRIYLKDTPIFGLEFKIELDTTGEQKDNGDIYFRNPVSYGWSTDPRHAMEGWSEQASSGNSMWEELLQKIEETDEDVFYGSMSDISI